MAKSRRKAGGCTRGRFRLKRLGKGWLAHRRLPVRETPRATLADLAELEAAMGPEKVITPLVAVKTVVPKPRKARKASEAAAKTTQKAVTPKKASAKAVASKAAEPAAKKPAAKKSAAKKPTAKTAGKKSPAKKSTAKSAGPKKPGGAKG
jgi:hypothetical protein